MRPISIMGLGVQSKSSNITSQKRINLYLEIIEDGDKSNVVAYGTPGLVLQADIGGSANRGVWAKGDFVYVVNQGTFWEVNNAGVATSKGTLLTTSGRVDMADNGTQIMIVDGTYGYIYSIAAGTVTQITDPDFPGANHVTFNDGYFIINDPDSGQFHITATYNGLALDALDYATAESNPDNLVRCVADHGELIQLGEVTTEFWNNTGGLDFPYTRSGAAIEWGIAARWSLAKFDNSLIWLAKNRMGEVQVVRLSGYTPQRVSNFDIETIFNSYNGVSDATGFSYLSNGHPFYQINFTSAKASWVYDGASNCWSELKSGTSRHRGDIAVNYLNRTVVCDYADGKIYNIDSDVYTDNGDVIVSELVSKHVFADLDRYSISELQVDLESGVGIATGQGSEPQIMLQISKDGGHTWGEEQWVGMGKIGEFAKRARWNRLGTARNWTFRLRISDPVKRVLLGAYTEGG